MLVKPSAPASVAAGLSSLVGDGCILPVADYSAPRVRATYCQRVFDGIGYLD